VDQETIENNKIVERRREIFKKLHQEFNLPSPSETVMKVIRLCNSEKTSLAELAEIIETDPALSAEILKYANSAFLATGIQVASVQKATVKLGMKTVVVLALGFSLLANNRSGECEHFDYPKFWSASLAKAIACRKLAECSGGLNPDELFICGLLSDIGSLSLATVFPEDYSSLMLEGLPDDDLKERERQLFGIDNEELTSELFISWGLPVYYGIAAGFHRDLDCVELGEGITFRSAVILHLAELLSRLCQSASPQPDLVDAFLEISKKYLIETVEFGTLFDAVVERWHEQGRMFEIDTVDCHRY
jgi:HD-like signal output (HDOD) protein